MYPSWKEWFAYMDGLTEMQKEIFHCKTTGRCKYVTFKRKKMGEVVNNGGHGGGILPFHIDTGPPD